MPKLPNSQDAIRRSLKVKFKLILSENKHLVDTINSYVRQAEKVWRDAESQKMITPAKFAMAMGRLETTYSACVKLILIANDLFEREITDYKADNDMSDETSYSESEATNVVDLPAVGNKTEKRLEQLEKQFQLLKKGTTPDMACQAGSQQSSGQHNSKSYGHHQGDSPRVMAMSKEESDRFDELQKLVMNVFAPQAQMQQAETRAPSMEIREKLNNLLEPMCSKSNSKMNGSNFGDQSTMLLDKLNKLESAVQQLTRSKSQSEEMTFAEGIREFERLIRQIEKQEEDDNVSNHLKRFKSGLKRLKTLRHAALESTLSTPLSTSTAASPNCEVIWEGRKDSRIAYGNCPAFITRSPDMVPSKTECTNQGNQRRLTCLHQDNQTLGSPQLRKQQHDPQRQMHMELPPRHQSQQHREQIQQHLLLESRKSAMQYQAKVHQQEQRNCLKDQHQTLITESYSDVIEYPGYFPAQGSSDVASSSDKSDISQQNVKICHEANISPPLKLQYSGKCPQQHPSGNSLLDRDVEHKRMPDTKFTPVESQSQNRAPVRGNPMSHSTDTQEYVDKWVGKHFQMISPSDQEVGEDPCQEDNFNEEQISHTKFEMLRKKYEVNTQNLGCHQPNICVSPCRQLFQSKPAAQYQNFKKPGPLPNEHEPCIPTGGDMDTPQCPKFSDAPKQYMDCSDSFQKEPLDAQHQESAEPVPENTRRSRASYVASKNVTKVTSNAHVSGRFSENRMKPLMKNEEFRAASMPPVRRQRSCTSYHASNHKLNLSDNRSKPQRVYRFRCNQGFDTSGSDPSLVLRSHQIGGINVFSKTSLTKDVQLSRNPPIQGNESQQHICANHFGPSGLKQAPKSLNSSSLQQNEALENNSGINFYNGNNAKHLDDVLKHLWSSPKGQTETLDKTSIPQTPTDEPEKEGQNSVKNNGVPIASATSENKIRVSQEVPQNSRLAPDGTPRVKDSISQMRSTSQPPSRRSLSDEFEDSCGSRANQEKNQGLVQSSMNYMSATSSESLYVSIAHSAVSVGFNQTNHAEPEVTKASGSFTVVQRRVPDAPLETPMEGLEHMDMRLRNERTSISGSPKRSNQQGLNDENAAMALDMTVVKPNGASSPKVAGCKDVDVNVERNTKSPCHSTGKACTSTSSPGETSTGQTQNEVEIETNRQQFERSATLPIKRHDPAVRKELDDHRILCLKNLPLVTKERRVLELASEYGSVSKIYFIKHKVTGLFQGTAYVKFTSDTEVLRAKQAMHGLQEEGNTIVAEMHKMHAD